jgi:hypothetical protein
MNDQELLKLAARAAGFVSPHSYREKTNSLLWLSESGFPSTWRPIDDNAQAFELAVKLGITVYQRPGKTHCEWHTGEFTGEMNTQLHEDDPYAATRRAVVRAAAEIGKQMELNHGNS